MVEFTPISYEAVTVGETFRSDDFLVKPEDIETFAYAVADRTPWYFDDSPFGGAIDPDWARRKGFKAPLVQAMMSTAYVSEPMVNYLGAGFVQGSRMPVSFTRPVLAGETLTVRGRVKAREAEGAGTRVTVEVWCENSEGAMAMIGTASGLES